MSLVSFVREVFKFAAEGRDGETETMKYYTARALGRVLGIGEDEVAELTRRGVIREGLAENGLFTLEESAREIISALKQDGARDQSADYAAERARMMRAKRQSAEYDLELREKHLHRTEDIETVITKILVGFKAKIRAIPSKMAAQCAKLTSREEIFSFLKKVTDEALLELSDLDNLFEDGTEETGANAAGEDGP